jgi:hypothetical protein
MKQSISKLVAVYLSVAAGVVPFAVNAAEPLPDAVEIIKVAAPATDSEPGKPLEKRKALQINLIDATREQGKERTWLGVSLAEPDETLVAQLALKDGIGLVVTHVAEGSPAAKAGVQKSDVLLELNGHNLIVPQQLQKLVQMRNDGEKVTLKLLRGGKKESVSVTLSKTRLAGRTLDGADTLIWHSGEPVGLTHTGPDRLYMDDSLRVLSKTLGDAKLDQERVQVEVRKSVDVARKAMEEALRKARIDSADPFSPAQKRELEALAKTGVFVPADANVTIRTTEKSSKSLVRADDSGTIVLVKNPKLRLTVHDSAGKLVFDAEVETAEQRAEIPADLRTKVEPLIEQFVPDGDE